MDACDEEYLQSVLIAIGLAALFCFGLVAVLSDHSTDKPTTPDSVHANPPERRIPLPQ